ncbi:MAG: hypothetical protein ABJB66_19450 [Gemmatimonadaceae bacterium]
MLSVIKVFRQSQIGCWGAAITSVGRRFTENRKSMHVVTRSTAAAALLSLASQWSFAQQAAPKAEEIFARHVSAIGGKEAILKVTSIKTIGTMQIVSMGLSAPVETIEAAPNRMSSKMTLPGVGYVASGYDGKTA